MPARGWPEGRPPPVRPVVPGPSFDDFYKKKIVGFIRLKIRCGRQSPNQLLCIADLRHVYHDAEYKERVCNEDDIRRISSSHSAYNRSFDILSSQAGGGNSRCFVLELGYDPHDDFYISGGPYIHDKISPVSEDEYRSQFLDGDDSDYDLLRFKPIFYNPHTNSAIISHVEGENVARGFLVLELQ